MQNAKNGDKLENTQSHEKKQKAYCGSSSFLQNKRASPTSELKQNEKYRLHAFAKSQMKNYQIPGPKGVTRNHALRNPLSF